MLVPKSALPLVHVKLRVSSIREEGGYPFGVACISLQRLHNRVIECRVFLPDSHVQSSQSIISERTEVKRILGVEVRQAIVGLSWLDTVVCLDLLQETLR